MKQEVKASLLSTILGAFATVLVTALIGIILTALDGSNGSVYIGQSFEYENGVFICSIGINNYKDSTIEKLRFKIPENISIKNIKTNVPLSIKKVSNNLGTQKGSEFEIERVEGNQSLNLFVTFSEEPNPRDIIVYNDNNIDLVYPGDKKIDINNIILLIFLPLTFGLISFITNYLVERSKFIKINEIDKKLKIIEKEGAEREIKFNEKSIEFENREMKIKKETEDINTKLEKTKEDFHKTRLIYISRIKDYNKELNFWRDTVRKLLYESKNKQIDSEILIKTVTESLGTYQVNCVDGCCLESIRAMSDILTNEESLKTISK